MIEPRLLKGFRDYLPASMLQKKKLIYKLESIFEKFGFVPIDTPALEYSEILLGKGGGDTEKQIYRFLDHGNRDVALRFDLTVPLARFVSLNYDKLIFPFKCSHIGPVWRGENTQKGRYREFYQCDFDILGSNSIESDIEILLIIKAGLESINVGDFRINVNNRKILNAMLKKLNLMDKSVEILRVIDKIHKIGIEKVLKELVDGLSIEKVLADEIIDSLNIKNADDRYKGELLNDEIFEAISKLRTKLGNEHSECINELELIFSTFKKMNILKYFSYNPSVTRGLDYYTGTVFESFILNKKDYGSICSGGRYDNLIGLYSKNVIIGVGASFGLDRIFSMIEPDNQATARSSNTDILIFNLNSSDFAEYQLIAGKLRNLGINAEVYVDKKKIQNQFAFAEKKSIDYVLFAGEEEIKNNAYNIKNIKTNEEKKSLKIEDIAKIIGK